MPSAAWTRRSLFTSPQRSRSSSRHAGGSDTGQRPTVLGTVNTTSALCPAADLLDLHIPGGDRDVVEQARRFVLQHQPHALAGAQTE